MRIVILWMILFSSINVYAQNRKIHPLQRDTVPAKLNIKYSLTSLLDITAPLLQLGVEYRVDEKYSMEHELGYMQTRLFWVENYHGIRLRNQLKYFYKRKRRAFDSYLGVHLTSKYINFGNNEVWVTRAGGAYRERMRIQQHYTDIGTLLGFGNIRYLKSAPISLDFGGALGFRRVFYFVNGLPEDGSLSFVPANDLNLTPLDLEEKYYFSMQWNVKIGYYID